MAAKNKNIPVNAMEPGPTRGIAIDTVSLQQKDFTKAEQYAEALHAHRDEGHVFHLLVQGTVVIDIDFMRYTIQAPAVTYMHPDQVHRIVSFDKVTVTSLAISSEHMDPVILALLEEIAPVAPLALDKKAFALINQTAGICVQINKQENGPLQNAQLMHSCNTLVALVLQPLLAHAKPPAPYSRMETIHKSFKQLLNKKFKSMKSPAAFSAELHVSVAYLNECVKKCTGFPVSYHIQQRVVLEAKRLLSHADKSIKEIADELGYEDPAYFSRLFAKITGTAAVQFRSKNHE